MSRVNAVVDSSSNLQCPLNPKMTRFISLATTQNIDCQQQILAPESER